MQSGQTTKQPASQTGQFTPGQNAHKPGTAGAEVSIKSNFSLIEYLSSRRLGDLFDFDTLSINFIFSQHISL